MNTIAFFNNKGGVGKTTLTYHVAWMLAEQGYTVLAADLDPQANLTSMFLDEDALEDLWTSNDSSRPKTVYQAGDKLRRGLGDILPIRPSNIPNNDRLFLASSLSGVGSCMTVG